MTTITSSSIYNSSLSEVKTRTRKDLACTKAIVHLCRLKLLTPTIELDLEKDFGFDGNTLKFLVHVKNVKQQNEKHPTALAELLFNWFKSECPYIPYYAPDKEVNQDFFNLYWIFIEKTLQAIVPIKDRKTSEFILALKAQLDKETAFRDRLMLLEKKDKEKDPEAIAQIIRLLAEGKIERVKVDHPLSRKQGKTTTAFTLQSNQFSTPIYHTAAYFTQLFGSIYKSFNTKNVKDLKVVLDFFLNNSLPEIQKFDPLDAHCYNAIKIWVSRNFFTIEDTIETYKQYAPKIDQDIAFIKSLSQSDKAKLELTEYDFLARILPDKQKRHLNQKILLSFSTQAFKVKALYEQLFLSRASEEKNLLKSLQE